MSMSRDAMMRFMLQNATEPAYSPPQLGPPYNPPQLPLTQTLQSTTTNSQPLLGPNPTEPNLAPLLQTLNSPINSVIGSPPDLPPHEEYIREHGLLGLLLRRYGPSHGVDLPISNNSVVPQIGTTPEGIQGTAEVARDTWRDAIIERILKAVQEAGGGAAP